MTKHLTIAILFAVCTTLPISSKAYAQGANLTGTWQVKNDKEPGISTLKLTQSGETVSGTWQSSHGDVSKIENGKIAGETLTFSFVRDTHPIGATGHVSVNTISLDLTGHKFGLSKTVHRTATRIASN